MKMNILMNSLPFIYLRRILTIFRAFKSDYSYSIGDYCFYLKNAESPDVCNKPLSQKIEEYDDRFIKIKIEDEEIIWPKSYNSDGLQYMYQEVFEPETNNPHSYEKYGAKISRGDHVIDGGGCEGFFTHYCLKKGATVTIIEPVDLLVEGLTLTFNSEINSGNVEVMHCALGNQTIIGRLTVNPKKIYESQISHTGSTISVRKLDDLCTEKVDFIKFDIENSEVEALMGSVKIIQKYKPKLSIAVYHDYSNAKKIISFLKEVRPDYSLCYSGIFAYDVKEPRPMMVYGW